MEHLDTFVVRAESKGDFEYLMQHPDAQDLWMYKIPIFSLIHNGRTILIYGCLNEGLGTYRPMVFAAEGIDKHTFAVVRCLYDYGDKFIGTDVRRFEAYVAVEDAPANKIAKFFGFEPVGFRRNAGASGEDQVIYERLWRK